VVAFPDDVIAQHKRITQHDEVIDIPSVFERDDLFIRDHEAGGNSIVIVDQKIAVMFVAGEVY